MGEGLIVRRGGSGKSEGAYVWKKFTNPSTTTIKFTIIQLSTLILEVSSDDIDLSTVTSEFFVGCSGMYSRSTGGTLNVNYEFTSSNSILMNGNSNTFNYDPSTKRISITVNDGYITAWGDTTADVPSIFTGDFVVSDNSTAYPDGGMQDGYWYEKVKDGITPEMFGFTKMAIDTFSFSSNTSVGNNLAHSLGKTPSFFMLKPKATPSEIRAINSAGLSFCVGYGTYVALFGTMSNGTTGSPTTGTATITSSTISVTSSTSRYVVAGVEYTLITMA